MLEKVESIRLQISEKLRDSGYKLTPQREVTVNTLIENNGSFLTAEEIFMAVKRNNSSIGLATVYRTLDLLDELKILNKKQFSDGLTRYELYQASNKIQPSYLICSNCNKVKEIREEVLNDLAEQIEIKYHFKVLTQDVTFHGLCEECQSKEKV